MKPPRTLNVIDEQGGFVIESEQPHGFERPTNRFNFKARRDRFPGERLYIGYTLWRPGIILKKGTIGQLLDYDENTFYQENDDVTRAVYRVRGYGYPVLAWFDNKTRRRLA